jgi:hypothetical protein
MTHRVQAHQPQQAWLPVVACVFGWWQVVRPLACAQVLRDADAMVFVERLFPPVR